MKLYYASIILIGVLIVALSVGYLSSRWLGDDNEIEELAEDIIKMKTGMDIDITPNSPEPRK